MRPFFVVWIGQAFSLLGSSLVQFALIWYLTTSTGSATVLAVASLFGLLPQIFFAPFAGALVDRWNRRVVMMVSDGAIALVTAALAILFALQAVEIWHVYLVLFVRSLGSAFQWPAMQASTSLMVSKGQLARVGGMNQALQGAANIITPPLGALLLVGMTMPAILMIDVSTAFVAIVPLLFIHVPQPAQESPTGLGRAGGRRSVLSEMSQGALYLWRWPAMLVLAIMGTVIRLLLWPGVAMLPVMVRENFAGGPLQLALLQSAAGIGLVAGGILLGIWGGFKRRIATAMLALLLDGLAIVLIGLSPRWGLSVAAGAFFCSGLLEAIHFGATGALFQALVPPILQGRLMGLLTAVGTAMVPVGLAVAGPIADHFGVQVWFIAGGLVTAAMATSTFLIRPIMHVEDDQGQPGRWRGEAGVDRPAPAAEPAAAIQGID
jgi:DHA3 family macrolide efflux protein-like MFS transporter